LEILGGYKQEPLRGHHLLKVFPHCRWSEHDAFPAVPGLRVNINVAAIVITATSILVFSTTAKNLPYSFTITTTTSIASSATGSSIHRQNGTGAGMKRGGRKARRKRDVRGMSCSRSETGATMKPGGWRWDFWGREEGAEWEINRTGTNLLRDASKAVYSVWEAGIQHCQKSKTDAAHPRRATKATKSEI
jgi:hypothetical protein